MLLQFTVRNYTSFRDEAVLSMLAGADKEHENILKKGTRRTPASDSGNLRRKCSRKK